MTRCLLTPAQIGLYPLELTRREDDDDRLEIRCDTVKVVFTYSRRKDKYHPRWRIWTRGVVGPEQIPLMILLLQTANQIIREGLPK